MSSSCNLFVVTVVVVVVVIVVVAVVVVVLLLLVLEKFVKLCSFPSAPTSFHSEKL